MKSAHFVTTCDDLVTTYFQQVVTAQTRAGLTFAGGCDDRDDLRARICVKKLCEKQNLQKILSIYARNRSSRSSQKGKTSYIINNLGCDDLPEIGRHKVVTVVTPMQIGVNP